jgi:hypothetical protein
VGLGGFLNFGLNHLNGKGGIAGWRWMFLVQGLIAIGKCHSENVWVLPMLINNSDWVHHISVDCRFPRELSQELPLSEYR